MRKMLAGLLVFMLLATAGSIYVLLTIGSPYVANGLRNAASRAEKNGRAADAEQFYRFALALDDCDTESRVALAALYERQDRFSAAEALLRVGIARYPDTAGLYLALARLYSHADMPVRAAELLDRADNPYAALTISGKRPDVFVSPGAGEYAYLPELSIESDGGTVCYYELNGVWKEYTEPVRLESGSPTVRAVAVSSDGIPSRLQTWHYTVEPAETAASVELRACCPYCGTVFRVH